MTVHREAKKYERLVRWLLSLPKGGLLVLAQLRRKARRGVREFFAPIYVSNVCHVNCRYCNMRAGNKQIVRRTLTQDEVWQEVSHLKAQGYTAIYILTGSWGEAPAGLGSLVEVNGRGIRAVAKAGLLPILESSPFTEQELRELWGMTEGRGRHVLFQESYDLQTYRDLHGRHGYKSDPDARIAQHMAALRAGWTDFGIGSLLGLNPDVAFEIACTLAHAKLLHDAGARRVAISVPRIQPGPGVELRRHISDDLFIKVVLVYGVLAPWVDLVLTAREPVLLRNLLWYLTDSWGVNGSTEPGGYTLNPSARDGSMPNGQFDLSDRRTLQEVLRHWR